MPYGTFFEFMGPRSWFFEDQPNPLVTADVVTPTTGAGEETRGSFTQVLPPEAMPEIFAPPPSRGLIATSITNTISSAMSWMDRAEARNGRHNFCRIRTIDPAQELSAAFMRRWNFFIMRQHRVSILPPQLRYTFPLVVFALIGSVLSVPVFTDTIRSLFKRYLAGAS